MPNIDESNMKKYECLGPGDDDYSSCISNLYISVKSMIDLGVKKINISLH
jgi:hypothetical protein